MKYLLLHYVDETAEYDAEVSREGRALLASWLEDTIARGVNLQGSCLQPSRNAATIRTRDGELLVSDGPFAETKEQVAGYDIIECADMREAIEVAGSSMNGASAPYEGRADRKAGGSPPPCRVRDAPLT
jgi:hypothetical protein